MSRLDDSGDLINDTLIVKSGTNYQNLSEIKVKILDKEGLQKMKMYISHKDTIINDDNVVTDKVYNFLLKRKYLIQVTKKDITTDIPQNKELLKHVESYYVEFDKTMKKPVLITENEVDLRFNTIRNYESGFATWVSNLLATEMGCDVCFFNSGSFRSDKTYPAGYVFTLEDIWEIFPIVTIFCQLEMDGSMILRMLENSVSKWPALEGRYLQLGGIKMEFDPSKDAGSRVIEGSVYVQDKPLDQEKTYNICTTDYMTLGRDGFDVLKEAKMIIDEENGPNMLDIIAHYCQIPNKKSSRDEFDEYKKAELTQSQLQDCYDRKLRLKNLYISNVLDAFGKSIVGGMGSKREILQKSNLPVVSEKIIDNTSDPAKNTENFECKCQNFNINKIRQYIKFALANSYQDKDDGVFLWSINSELKEKNCKVQALQPYSQL